MAETTAGVTLNLPGARYEHRLGAHWLIDHCVRFRIVAGEFAVDDELTPTQKVRRDHVVAKLARDVAERPLGKKPVVGCEATRTTTSGGRHRRHGSLPMWPLMMASRLPVPAR